MELKIGTKIRNLRKQKNISQEVLAQYLGVSFQAVSKWESGTTMPDVPMIPAIASFFGVSTDELFDYNQYELEKKIEEIVAESVPYRGKDDARCEEILREGLKKYPGNDVLLNCLLYSIPTPERSDEVISICKSLIEGTKMDDVRYDACRILAETYAAMGETGLAKETIRRIPEIYFTSLELEAELLTGEDKFRAADIQKGLSADTLLAMLECLADCYQEKGEPEKAKIQLEIAERVIEAFREDFPTEGMKTVYQCSEERLQRIRKRLQEEFAE
ncbi:MAG: helix-turn-helix domain-containing protein [Roseburia sp.]|nr:helix-turn-helix domain-containing protein [Roseburia sp.]MCM1097652.1 helix-turn-helix domain-containing protein [Ruminococcus flavefaciens]